MNSLKKIIFTVLLVGLTAFPLLSAADDTLCPYGGTISGPNCKVVAFEKPEVASGVDYWVNTDPRWPGVYYLRGSGEECWFGGSKSGQNYCKVASLKGLVEEEIYYWVDAAPKWPGVYYQQVNGECPYGGSVSESHCKILSFNMPEVYVVHPWWWDVSYWIDTKWLGVYYNQVNGECPFGGSPSGDSCKLISLKNLIEEGVEDGIHYWIDTNPKWPGIYYKQITD